VPDRYQAARWYEEVFGLQIMRDFEFWATEGGPLMLSSDGGHTKLALFQGEGSGRQAYVGFMRVAFHVNGAGFLAFLERLASLSLTDQRDEPVSKEQVVDHDKSWSIYFCDPWGNRFEVTTYDYALVKGRLAQPRA
jgi:catechol 2,3-dioxygenase-like lactoylglutathione lyase family enzyme